MTTPIPPEPIYAAPITATTKAPVAKRRAPVARSKGKPARKAISTKKAPRPGSKTAKILDLLKRPAGVSLKELTKATGWQAHSLRGFLSGAVAKKMGTSVESFKRGGGERAYRLSK
jgi:hypothetical protein